jgi:hypothetical protein
MLKTDEKVIRPKATFKAGLKFDKKFMINI